MHKFVSFNFQILSPQKVNLHAVSSAALYGKGIFTTLAIYAGKPFLWEKHWQRLLENAKRLSLDLSNFTEIAVKNELIKLIKENGVLNARVRITFFDESSGEIWKVKNKRSVSLLITTADLHKNSEKVSLTVSQYPINSRSPLVNIKSCNYFENIMAYQTANKSGFNEAVRLNEKGEIASGCLANIFWLKAEKIYTPSLNTGILRGTTREFILENFAVCETETDIEEIKKAETVFLTSAGIGIAEVNNFEQIFYKSNHHLKEIKDLFGKYTGNFK